MIHNFFQSNLNTKENVFEMVYISIENEKSQILKIVSFDELKTQKDKYKSHTIYHGISKNYDEKIYNFDTNEDQKIKISGDIKKAILGLKLVESYTKLIDN